MDRFSATVVSVHRTRGHARLDDGELIFFDRRDFINRAAFRTVRADSCIFCFLGPDLMRPGRHRATRIFVGPRWNQGFTLAV